MVVAGWACAAAVGLGLAARGAHMLETRGVPWLSHLVGDAAGYWNWAGEIAMGDWIGRESFYQAPLYPYALAVLFEAFGESVWCVRVVQGLGGGLAVGLMCVSGSRLFGRRCGVVAGIMLALYAPAIFFDGIVQKASMGCALTCGLLACLTWRPTGKCGLGGGAVGVIAAALVLTRENALVWLPILAVWIVMRGGNGDRDVGAGVECQGDVTKWLGDRRDSRERRVGTLLGFGLGVALVLGPVGVRNRVVGGEWSLSTFQSGPNFYIGNHRGASGVYDPLIRGHETPTFERRDATALAEQALGRELGAREVSGYWMSRAVADIREDPLGWAGLLGRKVLLVWNRYEVADVESQYVYAEFSSVLGVLGFVWHFGVLCPLAVVGLWVTWGRRRDLWIYYALIVSMAGSVAMFYVLARYRFVLVPLLIPFAAAGFVYLWDLVRRGGYRQLMAPAVVGTVVALVVNLPVVDERRLDAMAWMNLGVAVAEDGDIEVAATYFGRAVAEYPESAEANNNLAMALAVQGDHLEAIPHYEAALAADPTLMGVAYNLGVALERVGRVEDALLQYERAAELDAWDKDAGAAVLRLRGRR